MDFERALADTELLLTEGSMYERLRRHPRVTYDPHIAHSSLIYDDADADILADVHREYIGVARSAGLPMIVGTATWRANHDRLGRSQYADQRVNQENISFVKSLVASESSTTSPALYVGAALGPKGNAYRPDEALDADTARRFHGFQAEAIAEAAPDVLLGMTLPALCEALGLAQALDATGLPYMISFVVRDTGTLLDGTALAEAIDRVDQQSERAPIGYFVNCVHSSVLDRALSGASPQLVARLLGFRANTSDKSPEELDAVEELITEDPKTFAEGVMRSQRQYELKIVGGCCGTGTEHIAAIAQHCKEP